MFGPALKVHSPGMIKQLNQKKEKARHRFCTRMAKQYFKGKNNINLSYIYIQLVYTRTIVVVLLHRRWASFLNAFEGLNEWRLLLRVHSCNICATLTWRGSCWDDSVIFLIGSKPCVLRGKKSKSSCNKSLTLKPFFSLISLVLEALRLLSVAAFLCRLSLRK